MSMIKLGIKVAADETDKDRLSKSGAKSCEVRYILEKSASFRPILRYAKAHGIQTNFHHWAGFDGIMANPAAPGKFGDDSAQTIKDTLDIAKENNAGYVVYHTGTNYRNKIEHKPGRIVPLEQIASEHDACRLFTERGIALHRYAESLGVQLILETTPLYDPAVWMSQEGRLKRVSIGKLPLSLVEDLADQGVPIANDFEHTACNYPDHTHQETFDFLYSKSLKLADKTKLLHLGYLVPPYNGTDYHGILSNPEFLTDTALPNENEMLKLFLLYKNHKQLWILAEPSSDHVESYKKASNLLQSAGIRFE